MRITSAAAVCCAAVLLIAAANAEKFVVGESGTSWTDDAAPPGYVLASLNDVSSTDFLGQYNAQGLNTRFHGSSGFPAGGCPVFRVREGLLAFGSPLDVVPFLVAPYTESGVPQKRTRVQSPVWLGARNASELAQGFFLGILNASDVASLYIAPAATTQIQGCDARLASFGIYVRAQFFVARFSSVSYGPGVELAAVADVKSDAFLRQFNVQPGLPALDQVFNEAPCCAFRLQRGFLTASSDPTKAGEVGGNAHIVNPFTDYGTAQCPAWSLTTPVAFGDDMGYFSYLNVSVINDFGETGAVPQICNGLKTVWAIYKGPPGSLPPPGPPGPTSWPPAPSPTWTWSPGTQWPSSYPPTAWPSSYPPASSWPPVPTGSFPPTQWPTGSPVPTGSGDCYQISMDADYMFTPSCYAERYNYQVQAGVMVNHGIKIGSVNYCSYPVYANGVLLTQFNSTMLVASFTNFSQCSCPTQNMAFLPLSIGSSATLCQNDNSSGYCQFTVTLETIGYACP